MIDIFPIFFGARDAILGNGFVARVSVDGRAVMYTEDDRWWVAGVQPGGIVADGATQAEAYMAFREAIRMVLHDSAQLAGTFDAFRQDVQQLMQQVDLNEQQRWDDARRQIRAGADLPADGFVGGLPKLTKLKADPVSKVVVDMVKTEAARPEPTRPSEVQAAA